MLDAVQVQDCKNKQIEQSRAFAQLYYTQPWLFLQSTFPQTGADVIAHLLFVFAFQSWLQVKNEIKNNTLTVIKLTPVTWNPEKTGRWSTSKRPLVPSVSVLRQLYFQGAHNWNHSTHCWKSTVAIAVMEAEFFSESTSFYDGKRLPVAKILNLRQTPPYILHNPPSPNYGIFENYK